jgi:hypothetical protein
VTCIAAQCITPSAGHAYVDGFIAFFNDCFAVFADRAATAALTPSFWALLRD